VIVTVGTNPHGDPLSMQLMGREWADPQVLGYGYALEQHVTKPQTSEAPALDYVPGAQPRAIVIQTPPPPVTQAPAQTPPEEAPAPKPAAKKPVKAAFAKRAVTRRGTVRFVLHNESTVKLTGTVTLRAKVGKRTLVLGRAKLAVVARRRATLAVKLTRKARAALRGKRSVRATAAYALRNATGAKAAKRVTMTVKLR
jgi:amidase